MDGLLLAPQSSTARFSLERQGRAGLVWVGTVFALVVIWGGLAQISGAVVAPGRVTLESSVKKVQHRDGGIVSEILVGEGQHVTAGQVLVRLDPTVVNASDSIVQGQVWQLSAKKLRLEAERDGRPAFNPTTPAEAPAEYIRILEAERNLQATRVATRQQQKSQLQEQVRQGFHEIEGLEAQILSVTHQAELIKQELVSVRKLYDKGYAPFTRVSELQRQSEQLEGQRGELTAAVARTRAGGAQIRQRILEIDSAALSDVMGELKDTDTKLSQLLQQQVTTQDASRRVQLTAPVSGKIQQLAVHTKGGVVAPGETLMIVVPDSDELVVEARIDPQKRDDVFIGSRAHVRFTAFDTRTTPEVSGTVDTVSTDVETDEKSGTPFYRTRLTLDGLNVPEAIKEKLVAGMPVEVQIETGSRNAISYFLKPLSDQLHRTFKED